MKPFVVASVILSLGIGPAYAGDLPPPNPPGLTPQYDAPSSDWSGIYLGINGGYGFGSSQWTLGLNSTNIFSPDGFLLGGTLGVNYQINAVVFGLEGDLDWSAVDGSVAGCAVNGASAAAACETKNNMLGTARARMGYALDRTLIYVTGGAAFGNVETGLNPPATFDAGVKVGWSAGAGLEYAFARGWSARAEYLFADFGNAACSTTANCGSAAGSSVSLIENVVRGGINYKFSW